MEAGVVEGCQLNVHDSAIDFIKIAFCNFEIKQRIYVHAIDVMCFMQSQFDIFEHCRHRPLSAFSFTKHKRKQPKTYLKWIWFQHI